MHDGYSEGEEDFVTWILWIYRTTRFTVAWTLLQRSNFVDINPKFVDKNIGIYYVARNLGTWTEEDRILNDQITHETLNLCKKIQDLTWSSYPQNPNFVDKNKGISFLASNLGTQTEEDRILNDQV